MIPPRPTIRTVHRSTTTNDSEERSMRTDAFRNLRLMLFVLLVFCLFAPAASAQYFGRNKVQWEDFDFKVLKTEHFDIYYYGDEDRTIEDVGRMAERWYQRLSKAFNHQFDRKPIVLYANHADFQQTTVSGGLIPEGTGGFTEPFKSRVVLPLTGIYAENDHVLGHELVHVFQFDIADRISRQGTRFRLEMLPLWMVEGLAEYLSQGRTDPATAMWMRDAVIHDRLPSVKDLNENPRLSPYQYGQSFWAYVGGRWGDQIATRLFVAAGALGIEEGFKRVLDESPDDVFNDWHDAIKEAYAPVIAARQAPADTGIPLLTKKTTEGGLNVGPAVSPDGRYVAFLSSRDLFTIDLFLADTSTGEVVKRLVSSAGDPHFDALRFIDSAGSWSPDGKQLAFVVIEKGDNTIALLDVDSAKIVRRIAVPGVGGVSNPVWSPDGSKIAFSGSNGGITDLYVLDVASGKVRRITDDRFADLQPAWSPDGKTIAVVSDRGPGTDFDTLSYAPVRISLISLDSGAVQVLSLFDGAKHISPAYSPDGRSLYFISDPNGVADLFRYSFETGQVYRLTNVTTGISGITDLAPALSVASNTGVLMFSVFSDADWEIHRIDASRSEGSRIASLESNPAPAGVLPPIAAEAVSTVTSYLDQPTAGLLPQSVTFPTTNYHPKLSLDYVGPPAIGVGADRYGYGIGGSISLYFSDILGHHEVGVALQGSGASGGYGNQFGAQAYYLNQANRINWGGQLTHLPYVSLQQAIYPAVVDIDGTPTAVDVIEQRRYITTVDEAALLSQYPFSQTRRVELNGGYTRYSFSADSDRLFVQGNRIIGEDFTHLPSPDGISMFTTSAAYVGDNSFYGFVSPVRGWRYRFEVGANFGDLRFQTGLADYRQYFFARPVTFAVRGMHYGRYGQDAEDERLNPLFLGYGTLVRGYEYGSFGAGDCTPTATDSCPEVNRLLGSKIGVVNLEVRLPLFGTEDFGLFNLPYLPTELVGFVDSGVAWTSEESPKIRFDEHSTERVPVFSAGLAARIVLGGYLPLEFYYAKPFQRPNENFVFGFNISPGW